VPYGEGRDSYDVRGRTAHECIFNTKDGAYRCPNSQQGYTGFSTWTRGQSWAVVGFAEELELLAATHDAEFEPYGGKAKWEALMLKAARAVCDNFIENTPADGISYWDQGAPGLVRMGDYLDRPADPFNEHEPVDSTASAISCQGLFRLAAFLRGKGENDEAERYATGNLRPVRFYREDVEANAEQTYRPGG